MTNVVKMPKKKEKLPFEPMFARVLIDRERVEKIGSLVIPESAQSRYSPTKGTLVACGESCADIVKQSIGKTVVFAKYAGDWVKIGEREYFICQDEDILGVEYE